jgi:hypothetical protein
MIPAGHTRPNKSLVAQQVADSGFDTNASAPAPDRCWKPLYVWLVMIMIVLTVIAVIGTVCATDGCFSSSSAASTAGSLSANGEATRNPSSTSSSPQNKVTKSAPSPTPPRMADPVAVATLSPTSHHTANLPPMQKNQPTLSPTVEPTSAPTDPMTNATPTMAPRAEQVAAFINGITLIGRTIAAETLANDTAASEPEELALHWLVYYDTDLNLLPNTPTNRFRLQQRYALAILRVQRNYTNPFLGSSGDECEWDEVICEDVNLGSELGIQQAVTSISIDTYNNGNLWTGRLSADLGLLPSLGIFAMGSFSFGFENGGMFGTLPTQIGRLTNLYYFFVASNGLTGSLPSQIRSFRFEKTKKDRLTRKKVT